MKSSPVSTRTQKLVQISSPVIEFLTSPHIEARLDRPGANDFLLGNPQDMPLPGFTQALSKWVQPQDKDWFAYKMSEPQAQEAVAAALRKTHAVPFETQDILMTTGAFGGLSAVLGAITEPGDEVIYISPPWFFYTTMIAANYGVPVRVPCHPETFDLDLNSIQAAITSRTRGVLINSPNNPTGKIYPPRTLQALAEILQVSSERNARPIYLLSDESYNHIVFDGCAFSSPTAYYPYSFLIYTYGKTLLAPGQRVGYIALPPGMPEREAVRFGLTVTQVAGGYLFPNALLQHALPDLEQLSIDVGKLQERRDRLVSALGEMGYELHPPEGTFYLLVRSPLPDDMNFTQRLIEENIYCLPGSMFELPGYFRISLTASDEMIERALPGFEKAIEKVDA